MLEIAGMPILEHNVRLLAAAGVRSVAINLHYLPSSIVRHFGDGARLGVTIVYSHEERLLGTAGALGKLAGFFADGDFLLVYGDNLTTLDLRALVSFHNEKRAVLTMAVFERSDPRAGGIVALDDDDRIVRFVEKPAANEVFSNWVNAGYLVVSPSVLAMIPTDVPSDFGRDVFGKLVAAGEPVYGFRMADPLWWVDSAEDYERTKREAALVLGSTAPHSRSETPC